MALNLAEGFDLESMGLQSPDTYHHLIECMRLAFADGVPRIADPDAVEVPVAEMLSKDRAAERRGLIRPNGAMQSVPQGLAAHHGDTVYVAAVDGEGNACSLINSIYDSFGSGLVVPGAGIALHNRGASFSLDPSHPNALAPRKRPFHTLVPGMATRDGELWLTYGVMGTMQQAQGHFQVLVNMIDFGLDPQAALDAPRFRTSLDEGTYVEDLAPDEVAPELRRRGYDVTIGTPNAIFFGGGQVIERSPDTGALRGGSEPRNDGFALGW
jgi:gamma-glutamyltranspeptidase/glutathione hydrolase